MPRITELRASYGESDLGKIETNFRSRSVQFTCVYNNKTIQISKGKSHKSKEMHTCSHTFPFISLDRLANALMKYETLTGDDIHNVVAGKDIRNNI